MRTVVRTIAPLLSILFLASSSAGAQTGGPMPGQLSGPVADGMWDLAMTGDAIYGVADFTLFRSDDRGESWERVASPAARMWAIEVDSDGALWVATERGLYSRAAAGGEWMLAEEGDFGALVIDEGVIFAQDAGGSLYRSDDGGDSFAELSVPGADLAQIVPAAGAVLWSVVDGEVSLSSDNGSTWGAHGVTPNSTTTPRLVLLADGDVLLITDARFYRSSSSVPTWEELGEAPDTREVSSAIGLPDGTALVGYVADNGRTRFADTALFRLLPASGTSEPLPVTDELDIDLTPTAFLLDDDRLYMAGTYADRQWGEPWIEIGQIFGSDDLGESWRTLASTSFSGSYILEAHVYSEETIVAVRYPPVFPLEESTLIYRTDNGGRDWVDITPSEGDVRYSSYSMLSDGTIYMTRGDTTLYRSVDTGRTWQRVATPETLWFPAGGIIEIDPQNLLLESRTGFSSRVVFASNDGGETWQVRSSRESQEGVIDRIVGPSGEIWLAENTNVVVSRDSGLSWQSQKVISGGAGGNFITGITLDGDGNPVVVTFQRKLYTSTNGGSSWSEIAGSPGNQLMAITTGPTGELFVGARNGTVYRSTDGGETWEPFTSIPEPTTAIRSLMIGADDYLYIGTELRGLWRVSTSGKSDVRRVVVPEGLDLS